jgi:uncharacterized protein (TIGR03083 family)
LSEVVRRDFSYHHCVNHAQHCDALEIEVERFSAALEDADFEARVPSCPEWNVHDLAAHLGTIHRWAEYLVRVQAPKRVPSSEMGLELGPVDATWLRRGGTALLVTLRQGDPAAPMWAWGADQHLRFWSRRQLHETMVHRLDLELATGEVPLVEPEIASDAIDEFLMNLKGASYFSPKVKEIHGDHQALHFATSDTAGDWTIELRDDGFAVTRDNSAADTELTGAAADLLMVLYRRRDLDASEVDARGDRGLIDFWLTNSALE